MFLYHVSITVFGANCTMFFHWGGADLFLTTTDHGQKRMVVVETNSCPSGQKSMPLVNEEMEHAGYRTLLEKSFMPHLLSNTYNGNQLPKGKLAVLYDKNKMEASGYAAVLADLANEPVYLTPCYADDLNPKMRVREDGIIEICTTRAVMHNKNNDMGSKNGNENDSSDNNYNYEDNNTNNCDNKNSSKDNMNNISNNIGNASNEFEPREVWEPVRAAVRYVTQRPWTRIPPITRTLVFNPVLACLAGGRNKMLAAKAYDIYNAEIGSSGLCIYTPETIWDVTKPEIPLWVRRMGGLAVVKVPYANAGQGVWTITSESELKEFMDLEHRYDRFIVQALIGNNGWSSVSQHGRLYHVGTIPNLKGNIYAADLRLMIGSSCQGFFPVAIYARRARLPLAAKLDGGVTPSWDMLGTNLSVKNPDGSWGTETERLLLMDSRDFNRIGIGLDDLIEAYMQTVLAVMAIDGLACKLITPKGYFGLKLFQSLNPDPKLLSEMYSTQLNPPLLPLGGAKVVSNNGSTKEEGKSLAGAPSFTEERLAAELEAQVDKAQSQSQKPLARRPPPMLRAF
ncbi:uncharacterized protein LOC131078579 isoform X2 [Cryptomeria japonica]|uniref:uncharacterized protein LOC131078579 isoform X2 n=1 Tax=Cryptomeria japonica TaxID=3369 RepID=UPI0025ACE1C8|nr:uncharacterized protein LOC131078579 isoform X2 [Cryptomeria japonica]